MTSSIPSDAENNGAGAPDPIIAVENLSVIFKGPRRGFGRRSEIRAVRQVSLTINRGETVGLVGESGSGKSTAARAMLRLVKAHSGSIRLAGCDITSLNRRALRPHRRHAQMVFQDPYSSLNPSMTVGDSIAEPLRVHTGVTRHDALEQVSELLEQVGLARQHATRYPYQFSGGQRQRIAIARALASRPGLVILDEAVSALDVSTRNQVINLLEDLRQQNELAYLFIAHDLSVVRHISHRIAVMYLGQIVEIGPSGRVYKQPAHPYTQALLSAVPVPNPIRQRARERIILTGEQPDSARPPAGCAFHTRCPYVMDVCRHEPPTHTQIHGGGTVACHLQTHGLRLGGLSLPTGTVRKSV